MSRGSKRHRLRYVDTCVPPPPAPVVDPATEDDEAEPRAEDEAREATDVGEGAP